MFSCSCVPDTAKPSFLLKPTVMSSKKGPDGFLAILITRNCCLKTS